MQMTAAQLAERIGAELVGDGSVEINGVAPLHSAGKEQVTFLVDEGRVGELRKSGAGAVITGKRVEDLGMAQLLVGDVNAALIEALQVFAPRLKAASMGIDSSARVADSAEIGREVSIGSGAVIGEDVRIGEGTTIGAGSQVHQNTKVGKNCRLDGNVMVYHNCTIGDNVIIQGNSTVGSTGFGYSFIEGRHRLIPHNGGVIIGDDVEIGANCCIDRAKFENTVIGAGTKIDNLVQVGHNVVIGRHCVIAALVGIGGSVKIGDGVAIGGQVGITDNIKIGSRAMVAAKSAVIADVPEGQIVAGLPATERRKAMRIIALEMRLPDFAKQLKKLSSRVKKLEASEDDKE